MKEFFKKNWLRLVGVVMFVTAGVFALITSVCAFGTASGLRAFPETAHGNLPMPFNIALSQAQAAGFIYLAVFMSSLFVVAFLVMKMFSGAGVAKADDGKSGINCNGLVSGVVLIVGSVVALALFISGIALGGDFLNMLSAEIDAARTQYEVLQQLYAAGGNIPNLPIDVPVTSVHVDGARIGLNAARTAHINQISQTVIFTILFAVLPLVIGTKKLVCACRSK